MKRTRNLCRPGLTLLEVVIVMGILSVTIGVMLPKIFEAREVARGVTCEQRLARIGLAVRQFESIHRRLPAGAVISPASSPNCQFPFPGSYGLEPLCFDLDGRFGGRSYSWLVSMLPFLGEQDLHSKFDFRHTLYTLPTQPYAVQVEAFRCPSETLPHVPYRGSGIPLAAGRSFAKGNYAAFLSPVHLNHQQVWPGALGGFTPGEIKGQTLAAITDGQQTLLASEVRNLDRDWDDRGVWAVTFPGGNTISADVHPVDMFSATTYNPSPSVPGNTPNSQQARDQLPACSQPGYALQRMMPCELRGFLASSPRSNHPGGVFAVRLDGATTFIADNVDFVTFALQVSTNDGQSRGPSVRTQRIRH